MDVGSWLDRLYASRAHFELVGEPLGDPEDRGVPKAMQHGDVESDGYVRWRMLPGSLGAEALKPIEARTGPLPSAFKEWMTARHHLFHQIRTTRHLVTLPATPVHAPTRDLEQTIEAWGALVDAGWLPIGDYGGGAGPLCLDLRARRENGDAPVVWFDHEDLYS